MKRGIPVMIFVWDDVLTASRLYRKNPKAYLSEFVDDVRVFDFVDLLRGESEDNWIRPYKTAEDIKQANDHRTGVRTLTGSTHKTGTRMSPAVQQQQTGCRLPEFSADPGCLLCGGATVELTR
jgi:hypothetical protein